MFSEVELQVLFVVAFFYNIYIYILSVPMDLKITKQKSKCVGASLVAQWLRICLLMQGTRVRALVWEDPTCHGTAGPVSHSY